MAATTRRADPAPVKGAPRVVALDTNCIIALVCGWHEHHAATVSLVEQRLAEQAKLAIAAPALIEAYAVLTRLPPPHRLAPPDALRLLRDNFHDSARTVALNQRDYWSLLGRAPADEVHGGRTYDLVIAACARRSKADELITLNLRHFECFADDSLRITSPIRQS